MTNGERAGVLPVDKPAGPTSHDVVARARRALGQRRIGHTGTLDPFASGLLLLCIGSATRLAEYLTGHSKTYLGVMVLGAGTETDDATGTVIDTSDAWRTLSVDTVRAVFADLRGVVRQRPPAYSAKKVAGERMYRMAREGRAPELEPVEVEIHNIEITEWAPPAVTFEVTCSAGTYIRAIARDAGERLGVPAHLRELRRTAIGAFHVDDAIALDQLSDEVAVERAWIAPLDALAGMPRIEVDEAEAAALANGRVVERDTADRVAPSSSESERGSAGHALDRSMAAAAVHDRLVAIVESDGYRLRPRKVFV